LALFFAQIPHAQAADEIRLAKQNLLVLQAKSFQYGREYCGYLVVDARDVISVTPPTKGKEAECRTDDYPEDLIAFASYHIHGAEEGVDSYISTPGSRLWFIDSRAKIIGVICDLACLPEDRTFIEYPMKCPIPSIATKSCVRLRMTTGPQA